MYMKISCLSERKYRECSIGEICNREKSDYWKSLLGEQNYKFLLNKYVNFTCYLNEVKYTANLKLISDDLLNYLIRDDKRGLHLDYNFTFNTASNQTAFRPKQDDSSSYMRCEYAQRAYTAHVISRSTQTGANVDCSYGHTYQFNTGSKYFMINSVWESGYREGGIYATRNYGYSYNANGKWSPDSIPE